MTDVVLTSRPILERFKLDGRVALVTGAGQGIGRACSCLGRAGAAVAVVDIDGALAGLWPVNRPKGIDAIAIATDVTKLEQIQRMVNTVVGKWGKLTIAVNNAGMGNWMAAEEITEEGGTRSPR